MLITRALAILGFVIFAVLGLGLWLQQKGSPMGASILWGLVGGVVTAISAVGGAWWAEVKNLKPNQALAIVVVGMLGRMLFLGAWALVAIAVGGVDGLGFLGGFGAVYLVGQVLEVWMLNRLKGDQPS
ncbi:hypothetical protein [Vulgatibacter sp.]|uniref:hypothetical protein n=1 Tax=Vulgatibacter sp. TaxID=1971226 RepID=UPI003562AA37